jgi:hypothetical protein
MAGIQDACERLLRRLDDLKRYLVSAAALATQDQEKWGFLSREARAAAVVCGMAELEALTRTVIADTHDVLNHSGLAQSSLLPCLRQLAAHDVFESLRSLQDHGKLWEFRSRVTSLDMSNDVLRLPIASRGPQPPLDGRTLKPEHFNRLWAIYGLSGVAFPIASWSGSLQKLALMRNDIAHANLPFSDIFSQAGRSLVDIERYVDDIESFSIHFADIWCNYLSDEGYLQSTVIAAEAI